MKCISIIGNLGANAVRRVASDGKELMSFNVAVNNGQAEPVWFNCIGHLREKLLPFLVKGQCVCVVGDLSAGVYANRVDLTVNIDRIELCGARPESAANNPATNENQVLANNPAPGNNQQVDVY